MLVTAEFEVFRSKLPTFGDFFAAGNWIWLALVVVVLKVLHELGHGLACKRFRRRVPRDGRHAAGLFALPVLQCFRFVDAAQQMASGGDWGGGNLRRDDRRFDGCTFSGGLPRRDWLNALCLNVMVVGSLSTVLVNANPLLRYDGYYILSDLVEIPNLRQKASAILHRKLGDLAAGTARRRTIPFCRFGGSGCLPPIRWRRPFIAG